jgi:hypothetical protein
MLIITSYEDGVTEVMIHHVGNGSLKRKRTIASCHWSFNFMDK